MRNKVCPWLSFFAAATLFIWMALPAFSIPGYGDGPSIYDFSFSSENSRFATAVCLFVFSLITVILLLVFAAVRSDPNEDKYSFGFGIFLAIVAMAMGIVSFCFKAIYCEELANANSLASASQYASVIDLNAGPILYGIFSLISSLFAFFGVVLPEVYYFGHHYVFNWRFRLNIYSNYASPESDYLAPPPPRFSRKPTLR